VRWSYKFEDCGGYDCMTDAFAIKRDGQDVFDIDCSRFGQEPCAPLTEDQKFSAEALAAKLVRLLNADES
jgi:hypothetical protein